MIAFWIVVALGIGVGAGWWLARRSAPPAQPPSAPAPPQAPAASTADQVLEQLQLGVAITGESVGGEYRNAAARSMAGTHAGVLLDEAIERHLTRGLSGVRSEEVVELHGPPRCAYVVRSAPLSNGGAVAFVEDISERRRIDEVRTDFVANVSHELKTPVGALSVLAETLEDETDLGTVHRLAGRMLAEAERAVNTIEDLIELSRIELGDDRQIERVRVADVVKNAIERVDELAARNHIMITTRDLTGNDPGFGNLMVDGDRRELSSALGNLVENAVKYSDAESDVDVEVRCMDDVVAISVVDRGVGIPAKDVGRVFERFYRVDPGRSRATGGTGLGLSIVRNVATRHGGQVSLVSMEGAGSTFTLRLPVASPAHDQRAADRQPARKTVRSA